MIPKVRGALRGWMKTKTCKRITQSVINHLVNETPITFTLKMNIQPTPPETVNRKPEEQRKWIWYTIFYISSGTNTLNIDDIIEVDDKQYRIQSTTRWDEAGYRSNEAIEYFEDSPVVLA